MRLNRCLSVAGVVIVAAIAIVLAGPTGSGGTALAQANPFSVLFPFLNAKPKPSPARPAPRRWQGSGGNPHPFIGTYQDPNTRRNRRAQRRSSGRGGYRTMCVRLCDGYYWPVSYGVPSRRFRRDRAVCESSCGAPAELFYLSSNSDDVANMRSLGGKRYGKLKNAFAYRKPGSAQCKCKPDPWSPIAKARHARYAAIAAQTVEMSQRSGGRNTASASQSRRAFRTARLRTSLREPQSRPVVQGTAQPYHVDALRPGVTSTQPLVQPASQPASADVIRRQRTATRRAQAARAQAARARRATAQRAQPVVRKPVAGGRLRPNEN